MLFFFVDYINDCYSPPSAAGSSPYSLAPSSQGQMISPPPGAGTPQESMYNMSMNGGDSYSSMGANVQSQVSISHIFYKPFLSLFHESHTHLIDETKKEICHAGPDLVSLKALDTKIVQFRAKKLLNLLSTFQTRKN